MRQKNQIFGTDSFEDKVALGHHLAERLLDHRFGNLQQLHGFGQQSSARKSAVAVLGRFQKHMPEPGTGPINRIPRDSQLLRHLI